MVYWDTTTLVKLYAEEFDSDQWEGLAIRTGAPLRTSALTVAEMAFALRQKERRSEIAEESAAKLHKIFRADVRSGKIRLFPLGNAVIEEAVRMSVGTSEAGPPLRTLDGLHLATARVADCGGVATADKRMRDAAAAAGLRIVSP
ncbi:MAG: type II toxin-antitoxin system VapC family toxin [Opitutales bacterium]|nr:type II toxin-antitoxin system VapC family toxin [Opitutales bacterium]